jgi:U3 small nucleolar RNA-associated protein 24
MGKAKQTRKFAVAKKMISPKDTRVRKTLEESKAKQAAKEKKEKEPRQIEQANTALFFQYNEQLGPPYHILVDTNFINFSIRYVLMIRVLSFHDERE